MIDRMKEKSWLERVLRAATPFGLGALTVALILGSLNGMDAFDWATVIFASFMFFVSAVLRYRSEGSQ